MTSHTIHTHRWGMRITVAVLAVLLLTMTTLYLLTAAKLDAGAGQLDTGAGQAAGGSQELAAGAQTLADGADDLEAGAQKLDAGAAAASTGAASLSSGATNAAVGAQSLATGAVSLADGASSASDGASSVSDGAASAAAGAQRLAGGAQTAAAGAAKVAAGAKDASAGAKTLAEKTASLAKGVVGADTYANTLAGKGGTLATSARNIANGFSPYLASADLQRLVDGGVSIGDNATSAPTNAQALTQLVGLLTDANPDNDPDPAVVNRLAAGVQAQIEALAPIAAKGPALAGGMLSAADYTNQVATGAEQLAAGLGQMGQAATARSGRARTRSQTPRRAPPHWPRARARCRQAWLSSTPARPSSRAARATSPLAPGRWHPALRRSPTALWR